MISLPITWPTQEINDFCAHWLVAELSLFGSVLRSDFDTNSDVDILIDFAPNTSWTLLDRVRMKQELAAIIRHPVDLVRKDTVENSHNPIRKETVLSTARVVYRQQDHVSQQRY